MKRTIFTIYGAVLALTCFAQGAGNNLSFDGNDDYVDHGNIASLTTSFTLEAWIKPSSLTGPQTIISKRDFLGGAGSIDDTNYVLRLDGDQPIIFWYNPRPVFYSVTAPSGKVPINTWTHIVATYDGATARIYINGIEEANGLMAADPIVNTFPFTIGAAYDSVQPNNVTHQFNGEIDEARVWNVTRSQAQIRDNMSKKLTGSETGLIGYWSMDEGSGTTVADGTSNGYDGTLKP